MTVVELFRSLLDDGLKRVSLRISLPAQAYIGDLLVFYIHSDHLFDQDMDSGRKNIKTLSEFYFKAHKAPFNEKLNMLKQIGDRSLYLVGFFRESLNKKLVSLDYYLDMGQNAYESLAEHHPQEEIFSELSYYFPDLVDALSYIAQKKSIRTNKDLIKICNDYIKTGSKVAACQLEDHGFFISKKYNPH